MQPNDFCLTLKIDGEFKQIFKSSCNVWYTFHQFLSVLQIIFFARFLFVECLGFAAKF